MFSRYDFIISEKVNCFHMSWIFRSEDGTCFLTRKVIFVLSNIASSCQKDEILAVPYPDVRVIFCPYRFHVKTK